MLVSFDVECAGLRVAIGQQVDRRQIARRVVEEHVFRARIAGADRAGRRAGVPVVHGGVELQARVGAGPRRVGDLLPQVARLHGLGDLVARAPVEVPVAVGLDRFQELVGDAHRVVRVLARDGQIGFQVPVGVVDREFDVAIALLGELDHALDVVVGHVVAPRELDLALQRRVLLRLEAIIARAFAVHAGLQDRLQVLLVDLRAGDQRGNLLLLLHLPVDEGLDVRVVGVDDHHFRRAARRAARLDRARRAVADLQEAHQARRLAAAREPLVLGAQRGEVGAGAGAVLEQARLAHPQVHDAAVVHEIVGDRLDEAGVRLRVLVGRLRLGELAGLEINVVVALARAVDAVRPVQTGVEPLRRVRRHHLHRQHVALLVEEGLRVGIAVEVAALPAPIGPRAGEAIEHLLGGILADDALLLGQDAERVLVGNRAPQERRDGFLFDLLQPRRHTGFAEILLRQHVGGDLRPEFRHLDVVRLEHHRAIRVADLGGGQPEFDLRVGRLTVLGEAPFDPHSLPLLGAEGRARIPR